MTLQSKTWTGGDCPACGEAMPAGVVRCRYCHTSLVGSDGQIEAVVPARSEHASVASSLVIPNIDEFESAAPKSLVVTTPSRTKLPGKKGRGKDREAPLKATRSRTQFTTGNPASGSAATQLATTLVTQSDAPPSSETRSAAPSRSSESTTWNRLLWVVAALLLAPLCVSGPVPGEPSPVSYFVPPMIHSGDEPHYLVLINSVVRDGDIDVANNYADVHLGGNQAGRKFAGWAIDHHVNWYWRTHLIHWWQAYENQYPRWNKDADGHPVPTLRTDSIHRPVNSHEYSQHPPGLAWVLAPFVWPFRKTSLLEPVVLLCSSLVTAAGVWAFFRLIRPSGVGGLARLSDVRRDETKRLDGQECPSSGVSPRDAVLITVVAFLGTPLWHYARTLYVEPYLMACAVGAYAASLRFNRFAIAGMLLGIGTLLKIPFAVIGAPLIVDAISQRKWRDTFSLAAPIVIAVALQLVCNQRTFGGWWKFAQKWEWGYPLFGLGGLAFSWEHGLLLFSPVVLVSLVAAVPKWFRQQRREAVLMGTATILYVAVMASWAQWWGGTCYSARLIMPVVPFMLLPLGSLMASQTWKSDARLRFLVWSLAVVSVGFGAGGAFGCEHIWDKHPLQILLVR